MRQSPIICTTEGDGTGTHSLRTEEPTGNTPDHSLFAARLIGGGRSLWSLEVPQGSQIPDFQLTLMRIKITLTSWFVSGVVIRDCREAILKILQYAFR